ncbi:unnamed protein product [Parajaminaea phylloscopi]
MVLPTAATNAAAAAVAALLLVSASVSAQSSASAQSAVGSAASVASSSSSRSSVQSGSSSTAVAASSAALPTASSNFTLPSGAATATWPAGLVLQSSVPYTLPQFDLEDLNLPAALAHYHLSNETLSTRQAICDRQTKWCATAGCAEAGAKINENFCDPTTMGTRCTCNKGASLLDQHAWPVQVADCQNRANACTQACWNPSTNVGDRNACISNCAKTLRETCSTPGQISANYAVAKEGDKPSYALMQGGSANGVLGRRGVPDASVVAFAASLLMAAFAVSTLI